MPTRRRIPGKRVGRLGLTTANSFSAAPNNQDQWVWPKVKLEERMKKLILSRVVEQLVLVFCETQIYMWRGKYYR